MGALFPPEAHALYDVNVKFRKYESVAAEFGARAAWLPLRYLGIEGEAMIAPSTDVEGGAANLYALRLHGIVQVPPPVNHPARVAERVATLDLVSGGRVDFGTGEASSAAELGGFGVPREEKRAMWEDSMDAITRMFAEEPFQGWESKYLRMPPRNVIPKTVQKPHPPLWVACSRRETIRLAARKGIGALSFSFAEPEEAGAAIWHLPQPPEVAARADAAKRAQLAALLGPQGLANYRAIVDFMAPHASRAVPPQAWYLSIVGIAPSWQGQGLGARLLAPALARATAHRRPCYLETFTPRNLPFYERLGFRPLAMHREPVTGADYWIMLRD